MIEWVYRKELHGRVFVSRTNPAARIWNPAGVRESIDENIFNCSVFFNHRGVAYKTIRRCVTVKHISKD
jgi:hypothetical protein